MAGVITLITWDWIFRDKKALPLVAASLLMVTVLYGYAASATFNAVFDEAPGQTFQARVLNKRISSGKTTTYYFTVTAWGPFTESGDVQVDRDQYQATSPGSQVRLRLRPGRLGVPWFAVE